MQPERPSCTAASSAVQVQALPHHLIAHLISSLHSAPKPTRYCVCSQHTAGRSVHCSPLRRPAANPALTPVQYYFETIFPRIPKPVADDLAAKLADAGLPAKAIGNGAQGGPDRRGIEEANRRPASVKVWP